jgi:4-hydroxybenzoate polyprenyltransferase
MSELFEFARTIRLEHSLFALPFALGAAMLAEPPYPAPAAIALLVVCMVTARTAAMGFNRVADAALDARNPRTRDRAIPAGRLGRGTALAATFGRACWPCPSSPSCSDIPIRSGSRS